MQVNLERYQIASEIVYGALFFMNCYLVYLFTWQAWKRAERGGDTFYRWRSRREFYGATALALYFAGATGMRCWEWAQVMATNLNTQYDWPPAEVMLWLVRNSWALMVLLGLVMMAGGVSIATVFAPEEDVDGSRRIRGYRVHSLSIVCLLSVVVPLSIFLILHGWP